MPTNVGKLAVANDQNGLTATSIRTVIFEAAADTIIGPSTASSTEAFSTNPQGPNGIGRFQIRNAAGHPDLRQGAQFS
jgi:hypothetical protein